MQRFGGDLVELRHLGSDQVAIGCIGDVTSGARSSTVARRRDTTLLINSFSTDSPMAYGWVMRSIVWAAIIGW